MAVTSPQLGKVYLVGAGPGDPGLITVRGVECLRRADRVLYDYLVNPQILELARPDSEKICLGKHGTTRVWPQEEINACLVESARAGKTVVRLKCGDPTIFARLADEVEALTQNAIPFEIVPGVTAALAASSYVGVPLTHRDFASAVALVTGQENPEKASESLDYAALAAFPGTLVFYMGVTTAGIWAKALVEAGKPAQTPVALIRRCSFPDQKTWRCPLDEVPLVIQRERIRPPVIAIVGPVAEATPLAGWFEARPLFGQTVMVTRAADQAGELSRQLAEFGASVVAQPAIKISAPADWSPVDSALSRLNDFDCLVFSSSNGVRSFLDRLLSTGRDLRTLGRIQLAAIGPGTANALASYHLRADLQPAEYRAESLAAALAPHAKGRRFLLARASRGRDVLAEELQAAGGQVEQIVVYASTDVTTPMPEAARLLNEGKIDWVTVTSSAIARSLAGLFGESLRRTKLASISPITSGVLREFGYEPAVEAKEFTMTGLLAEILKSEI